MQYSTRLPILDDDLPEDDIDKLFQQLEPIEPPPSFVSHLLSQVAANTTALSPFASPVLWYKLEHWAVQQQKYNLS